MPGGGQGRAGDRAPAGRWRGCAAALAARAPLLHVLRGQAAWGRSCDAAYDAPAPRPDTWAGTNEAPVRTARVASKTPRTHPLDVCLTSGRHLGSTASSPERRSPQPGDPHAHQGGEDGSICPIVFVAQPEGGRAVAAAILRGCGGVVRQWRCDRSRRATAAARAGAGCLRGHRVRQGDVPAHRGWRRVHCRLCH